MAVRRAAVAGSWYPDDPARLTQQLTRYVDRADIGGIGGGVRAVIAPHAGVMYSGPVAGFSYKGAAASACTCPLDVGPSPFGPFRGVSVWPDGSWETPLGAIPVDEALGRAIRDASSEVVELPAAHGREHSLELQLPFIAHLLPGTAIVPLVMGHQTRATAFAL